MAFCIQCGSALEDNWSFCENCGAPVNSQTADSQSQFGNQPEEQQATVSNQPECKQTSVINQPADSQPQFVDQPTDPQLPYDSSQDPSHNLPQNEDRENRENRENHENHENHENSENREVHKVDKTRVIIAVVVAVSIVIAAALGTLLYFELNKVKLPNASEFARTSITKMTKKLEKQGLSVRIKDEFNKRKRGSFLRLDGTNPGNSVLKFNPVTIVQSKGPGVPSKGIVGKKVGSVTKILKKMGVEVKVHNVVVDNKPTGEVIGSEPIPGYSVINGNKGVINLAVASKNKGIPVNIFGMDKDKAKEKLNSLGFNDITLKPHFASKKMIGKIMGTYPSLGSQVTGGHIDLLYGVDASGARSAIATDMKGKSLEYKKGNTKLQVIGFMEPLLGTWCTKSGDCINLGATTIYTPNEYQKETRIYTINGYPGDDFSSSFDRVLRSYTPNTLEMSTDNLMQMILDVISSASVTSGEKLDPHMKDLMHNHLIAGDTGAIEFYQSLGVPYCGDDLYLLPILDQKVCEAGHLKNYDGDILSLFMELHNHKKWTGMSYKMTDFFVAIPVNAKLSELESSGYFKGKGKKQPDPNRPFILRRDPKLYKETVVPFDGEYSTSDNPFVPTSKHKPVPFAPAPDDSNAYYLVEQPFDWSSLK